MQEADLAETRAVAADLQAGLSSVSFDFSTDEFLETLAATAGGSALCGIAGIASSAVLTPAGAGAAWLCRIPAVTGAATTFNDIGDSDNSLWTDEFFR